MRDDVRDLRMKSRPESHDSKDIPDHFHFKLFRGSSST